MIKYLGSAEECSGGALDRKIACQKAGRPAENMVRQDQARNLQFVLSR